MMASYEGSHVTAFRPFVFIFFLFCIIVCFDFLFRDLRWELLRYMSYFVVLAINYFRFTAPRCFLSRPFLISIHS